LGSEHPDTGFSLNNLAALYKAMGDYAKAEPLYIEAVAIRRKLGRKNPGTAESLNNLAELYKAMGDYERAEPLLEEALEILKTVLGRENRDMAAILNNLGMLYWDMRNYAKAEPPLKEALEIREKVLGHQHRDTAESLGNLAKLYWAMDDYARAEPPLKEALEIQQKVLGRLHPDTATSLNNLAALHRAMGDYAEAEPLYRQALEIFQKTLGKEHPQTVATLSNLVLLEFDLGRTKDASTCARHAADAERNLLSKVLSFSSEPQRLAYLATLNPYSLFTLLPGCEADLALALLRYKGVVLDSVIEDRLLAQASTNVEDQNRVERLDADRRQLDRLLLQSPEASQQVEELEQEVEKIESQLAQHVAGMRQARHALGVRLDQVQLAIPNDGTLIEYLRYLDYLGRNQWEWRYGAIVLFSKGAPLWIPLGKANEIEALMQRYGTLVRGSPKEDELSANLHALYEALWAPIGQALPSQTKRIIISPDGQLNFISFATLLTEDSKFLAQKCTGALHRRKTVHSSSGACPRLDPFTQWSGLERLYA
jgi:tetratricopeptide (TPR) repeat protein